MLQQLQQLLLADACGCEGLSSCHRVNGCSLTLLLLLLPCQAGQMLAPLLIPAPALLLLLSLLCIMQLG
jgi:hypothetical protein